MSTGVYRQYPSQQPQRYDATVFAPAANPFLIGPQWDTRAAFRREDPEPQASMRGTAALFTAPPASVPPSPVLTTRRDTPPQPQNLLEPQAPFLTQLSAAFLLGPTWGMRATLRREDPRPQQQIGAAAVLDDTVMIVCGDSVQPLAVFAREQRGLPLPSLPLAAIASPVPLAYQPPQPVLTVPPPPLYPTQAPIFADVSPFAPPGASGIPPSGVLPASFMRMPVTPLMLAAPSAAFGLAPAPFLFNSMLAVTAHDSRSVVLPVPAMTPALASPDIPPLSTYVEGTFARMQFAWPQSARPMPAPFAIAPIATSYLRGEAIPLEPDDRRIVPRPA